MDLKSTQSEDHTTGLKHILELEEAGVNVARGGGSLLQKTAVIIALAYGLLAIFSIGRSNSILFLILPVVILAIDFLSGFVHWFFDTQIKPSGTFLGRIAIDFLDHHVRPRRTVDVGFFASASRPATMVSLPLLTLALVLQGNVIISSVLLWIGLLSMLVPQTHKLAHRPEPGHLTKYLQMGRLMIHPVSHQKHHADNTESFCVFTGWLNPVLDSIRFWRGMEHLFANIKGK
ncbi:MAG: hypothetical protein ACI9CB_002104 [Rhodothermales bacterium]|jgi:hypothetical protein